MSGGQIEREKNTIEIEYDEKHNIKEFSKTSSKTIESRVFFGRFSLFSGEEREGVYHWR